MNLQGFTGLSELKSTHFTDIVTLVRVIVVNNRPTIEHDGASIAGKNEMTGNIGEAGEIPLPDHFFIDSTASVVGFNADHRGEGADVINDFETGIDKLRFSDDGAAENSTTVDLFTRLEDIDGNGGANDLVIYATQGNANSALAVMIDVAAGFNLTDNDVWEDATIVPFVEV